MLLCRYGGAAGFVVSALDDGFAEASSRYTHLWNMVQLCPQFVGAVLLDLQICGQRRVQRHKELSVDTSDVHVNSKFALETLGCSVGAEAHACPLPQVSFGYGVEEGDLQHIACSIIWHFERVLSSLNYPVSFLIFYLLNQCLPLMHCRPWKLGWPIMLRIVPVWKSWLLLPLVFILKGWNMVWIEGVAVECTALLVIGGHFGPRLAVFAFLLLEQQLRPFVLSVPPIAFNERI